MSRLQEVVIELAKQTEKPNLRLARLTRLSQYTVCFFFQRRLTTCMNLHEPTSMKSSASPLSPCLIFSYSLKSIQFIKYNENNNVIMRVRNFQAIKGRIIIILAVVGFLMVSFCLEPIKTYLFAAEASGKKGN